MRRPQQEVCGRREKAIGLPSLPRQRLLACDVRPVIYEKISGDHGLVSGQHNLFQKVRAEVLLHPGILEVAEEMTSDRARPRTPAL